MKPGRQQARLCFSLLLGLVLASCMPTAGARGGHPWSQLASRVLPPSAIASPGLGGFLKAPGGPFLYDARGRVVFLHGTNAVYKYPPYALYTDPGAPWNFDVHDASLLAHLGFDVVRLGITWSGLEPGIAPANDPGICTHGPPADPKQFDTGVLRSYLARVNETVNLLARYHIYTLLDMHQDVYNEVFDGEGAPNWAVCTDGIAPQEVAGRWSNNYAAPATDAAYRNFWTNDAVGDLQGEYDRVWAAVASYFAGNRWVVGYDPVNEPFSMSLLRYGLHAFDDQLLCFYEGSALAGRALPNRPAVSCPPDDPAQGLIPGILAADPHHLVFYEPDIFAVGGAPNFIGAMNLPRLVFNFHAYCGHRSGVTGNPSDLGACAGEISRTIAVRQGELSDLSSGSQHQGPAWFMSEFGATSDSSLLWLVTSDADRRLIGWSYWSWRYYDDPTGSSDEALVRSDGRLRPSAMVLVRTYAQAVAGTPTAMSYDPTSGEFRLVYLPNRRVKAPTVVYLPLEMKYPHGYCAQVTGGTVVSHRDDRFLQVNNHARARTVRINVSAGPCPE